MVSKIKRLRKMKKKTTQIFLIKTVKWENWRVKWRLWKTEKINEKTLDNISKQISADSINLTIFGILYCVSSIGLGIDFAHIERKIGLIREENKSILSESIKFKDEVVLINNQTQKYIYGLFLKIKREETIHILDLLKKIPEDISNFSQQLLSRELEKKQFYNS